MKLIHRYVDGAHFYTTEDPRWVGICSAHRSRILAYLDAWVQAAYLVVLNKHG